MVEKKYGTKKKQGYSLFKSVKYKKKTILYFKHSIKRNLKNFITKKIIFNFFPINLNS